MARKDVLGFAADQSKTLVGVFLSLILKSSLDHFFVRVPESSDIKHLLNNATSDPVFSCVLSLQLFTFLFLLVRFYLGLGWFAERQPVAGTLTIFFFEWFGLMIDLSALYVTSLTIRTSNLFCLFLLVVMVIDIPIIQLTRYSVEKSATVAAVRKAFVFCDIASVAALIPGVLFGTTHYWPKIASLILINIIGTFETRIAWKHYTSRRQQ